MTMVLLQNRNRIDPGKSVVSEPHEYQKECFLL